MERIVAIATTVSPGKVKHDDDTVDRMSNRYTVIILVVFAIVASANQYVGNPIACWAPAHFTGSHMKFTNDYCWVRNTYFLPYEDYIPKDGDVYEDEVIYYQWVPFILLGQAFFFYFPRVIWTGLNQKSGVDSDNILDAAKSFQKAENVEGRAKTLMLVVNQMDRFLGGHKWERKKRRRGIEVNPMKIFSFFCCCCGKRFGNYLVLLYLVSKVFYLANIMGQLFILNAVLGHTFNVYGFEVLQGLYNDQQWSNNSVFPRVTMCDFKIRILGNVQRYTVQCVLPINLYVERMYQFLWFWFVFLLVVTLANFGAWVIRALSANDRKKYIQNHLRLAERIKSESDRIMSLDFVDSYLRQDGVFLFQLIGHNTNNVTVNEIVGGVWDHWMENQPALPVRGRKPSLPPKPKLPLDDDSAPLNPTAPFTIEG